MVSLFFFGKGIWKGWALAVALSLVVFPFNEWCLGFARLSSATAIVCSARSGVERVTPPSSRDRFTHAAFALSGSSCVFAMVLAVVQWEAHGLSASLVAVAVAVVFAVVGRRWAAR
jgi:hypothetical protein